MKRMLECTHDRYTAVRIDQRHAAADGREDQRPPAILRPSNAREQDDRQGKEAQDEAGVEVGPDQEDDRKPRARLWASEGGVEDEDPAEERIQLRSHVEE